MTRTRLFSGLTIIVGALVALAACTTSVAPDDTADETPEDLTAIADRLVEAGYPAAIVTRTSAEGAEQTATAGTADLATDVPVPRDGEVRVGSASKTFTAVVTLQLVQEGLLDLDQSIESYLPGVVKGEGISPDAITVRQLLQHTSGLPEYADIIAEDAFAQRDIYRSPRDMLEIALERPARFPAGERYEYSNAGYLALGLIIERVSQRPLSEQIHERIVAPLGLEHTYFPAPGETELRGDHPLGYHVDTEGALRDITTTDPSWTWAAGAMVSTPAELNVFMQSVLKGKLFQSAVLTQMLTGIPTGEELLPGSEYGLGIESVELSCGKAWGHSGDIPGFQTRNAVKDDGSAFTVSVTALPWAIFDGPEDELLERYLVVIDTLDEALCVD